MSSLDNPDVKSILSEDRPDLPAGWESAGEAVAELKEILTLPEDEINLSALADEVYALLKRELQLERQRQGQSR